MTLSDTRDGLPLQRFLAPLPASDELHLSLGADPSGHVSLTALPRDIVAQWMGYVGHNHKSMDDKTRAAYLIGDISWALGLNLGAMQLAGIGLPDIAAEAIAVAPQWYRWEEDGESGDALRFTMRMVAAPDASHRPLDAAGIAALVVAAHTPLIETLFEKTRLGRSAMWRLVADAVAASWLVIGKRIEQVDAAMESAMAIVRTTGSPLINKQTGFVEIVVRDEVNPDRVLGCEWFRARGGCCRYYTTEESEGGYCSTCVLRTPESRDELLYNYVKGKAEAAA